MLLRALRRKHRSKIFQNDFDFVWFGRHLINGGTGKGGLWDESRGSRSRANRRFSRVYFRIAGQPARTLLDYADLSLPIEALLSQQNRS